MTLRVMITVGAIVLSAAGFGLGRHTDRPHPATGVAAPPDRAVPHEVETGSPGVLIALDPFRKDRRPAASVIDPGAAPPSPTPERSRQPVLTVVGIVLGSASGAMLTKADGDGAIRTAFVATGDAFAGFILQSVTADSVVLVARDSVIVLRSPRP